MLNGCIATRHYDAANAGYVAFRGEAAQRQPTLLKFWVETGLHTACRRYQEVGAAGEIRGKIIGETIRKAEEIIHNVGRVAAFPAISPFTKKF